MEIHPHSLNIAENEAEFFMHVVNGPELRKYFIETLKPPIDDKALNDFLSYAVAANKGYVHFINFTNTLGPKIAKVLLKKTYENKYAYIKDFEDSTNLIRENYKKHKNLENKLF